MDQGYWKYWGKASTNVESGAKYHLLPYHCLDVAAVGYIVFNNHPFLKASLARLANLPEETLIRWVITPLALHDLGKFAETCQTSGLGKRPIILRISSRAVPARHAGKALKNYSQKPLARCRVNRCARLISACVAAHNERRSYDNGT